MRNFNKNVTIYIRFSGSMYKILLGTFVVLSLVSILSVLFLKITETSYNKKIHSLSLSFQKITDKTNKQKRMLKKTSILISESFDFGNAMLTYSGSSPVPPEVKLAGTGGPGLKEGKAASRKYIEIFSPAGKIERQHNILKDLMSRLSLRFQSIKEDIDNTPSYRPAEGAVTSGFGLRFHPILHELRMHMGMDIKGPIGTPVHAAASGTISVNLKAHGYGKMVRISHSGNYSSAYCHLSSIIVKDKQYVKKGEIIGYIGNSGLSAGPHLHFEIRKNRTPVNPEKYICDASYCVD
ncbi:MAG: M23 family metallopeptidase [Fibrobacterota bacterium]